MTSIKQHNLNAGVVKGEEGESDDNCKECGNCTFNNSQGKGHQCEGCSDWFCDACKPKFKKCKNLEYDPSEDVDDNPKYIFYCPECAKLDN